MIKWTITIMVKSVMIIKKEKNKQIEELGLVQLYGLEFLAGCWS